VESLHNRAATLIFGSSFASSLLGSRALADGLGIVRRLREAFQLALVLLLNILAWLFSIAGSPT
jgi:hypothetical protein